MTFTYDGDGKRVRSVMQTVSSQGTSTITTYFVGSYYEVTGSSVTKYYYAGSQRIAMSKDGTLSFIIGDHLGSTSLTTDVIGNIVSEMKYKAWGEVRYNWGGVATGYTYTGQYSYAADFGLMFYNARWYDPSLGRFAQADTIVPEGIQGYDRYAYSNNNSLKYTDPSGHRVVEDDGGKCIKSVTHYCKTGIGATVDTKHFNDEIAADFWRQLLRAWKGKQSTITTQPAVVGVGKWEFQVTYKVNLTGVKTEDELRQIGAGMWWDYEIRLEKWEGTLPPGLGGLGQSHSTFQNEDIPSTFLSYVAASYGGEEEGWDFDRVMKEMGGAVPSSHTGGGARGPTIRCLMGGICDQYTSRNNTIYFKVQNEDKTWSLLPYPESLNVVPIQDPQYYTYKSCTTNTGGPC